MSDTIPTQCGFDVIGNFDHTKWSELLTKLNIDTGPETGQQNFGICGKKRFIKTLGNDQVWEGKGDYRKYNTDFVGCVYGTPSVSEPAKITIKNSDNFNNVKHKNKSELYPYYDNSDESSPKHWLSDHGLINADITLNSVISQDNPTQTTQVKHNVGVFNVLAQGMSFCSEIVLGEDKSKSIYMGFVRLLHDVASIMVKDDKRKDSNFYRIHNLCSKALDSDKSYNKFIELSDSDITLYFKLITYNINESNGFLVPAGSPEIKIRKDVVAEYTQKRLTDNIDLLNKYFKDSIDNGKLKDFFDTLNSLLPALDKEKFLKYCIMAYTKIATKTTDAPVFFNNFLKELSTRLNFGRYGGFELGLYNSKAVVIPSEFFFKKRNFGEAEIINFFKDSSTDKPTILVCPEFDYEIGEDNITTHIFCDDTKYTVDKTAGGEKINIKGESGSEATTIYYYKTGNWKNSLKTTELNTLVIDTQYPTEANPDSNLFRVIFSSVQLEVVDFSTFNLGSELTIQGNSPTRPTINNNSSLKPLIGPKKPKVDIFKLNNNYIICLHLNSVTGSNDYISKKTGDDKKLEIELLNQLIENIKFEYPNANIIVAGDFNFPIITDEVKKPCASTGVTLSLVVKSRCSCNRSNCSCITIKNGGSLHGGNRSRKRYRKRYRKRTTRRYNRKRVTRNSSKSLKFRRNIRKRISRKRYKH
jgi:hypothetical protein